MAHTASVSQTGTGSSGWIPVARVPFTSVAAIVSGTVTYSVEHTYDDVFDPSVTPATFAKSDMASKSNSTEGVYTGPIVAVRVTVASGDGTVRLVVLQP